MNEDRDETDAEIVERLRRNWQNYSKGIGDALKRLINSLNSGDDINLSGIDRDLIVYAMAFTASAQEAKDHIGDLTKLAAELHRAKWQFSEDKDLRPFNELHRIGDIAIKMRDAAKATLNTTKGGSHEEA